MAGKRGARQSAVVGEPSGGLEAGRVGAIERVVVGVGVGLVGGVGERVGGEELSGGRVVVARGEVVESGVGVGVVALVADRGGGGAGMSGGLAVGVEGVGGGDLAGGVGEGGDGAVGVVVEPGSLAGGVDLFERGASRALDVLVGAIGDQEGLGVDLGPGELRRAAGRVGGRGSQTVTVVRVGRGGRLCCNDRRCRGVGRDGGDEEIGR